MPQQEWQDPAVLEGWKGRRITPELSLEGEEHQNAVGAGEQWMLGWKAGLPSHTRGAVIVMTDSRQ